MATGRSVGRPAKPIERHRATGNPSKKKLPDAPLAGDGLTSTGRPVMPRGLGPAGKAMWSRVWSGGKSWVAPISDRPLVEQLCRLADEVEILRKDIASGKTERWYTTANGQVVTHPAVKQLADGRVQMTTWLSMLGFSPSDRGRLGLTEVRVKDEDDEMTRRIQQREAERQAQVEAARAAASSS